jgi:hypothetical protein
VVAESVKELEGFFIPLEVVVINTHNIDYMP